MIEDSGPEQLELSRHMLLVMDAPQHTLYRQPLAPHFGARVIGRMEAQIRARCAVILDAAGDQGDVDFCRDVAGPLPAQVMGEIMGLPREDTGQVQRWAEVQLSGQDDEVVSSYAGNAMADMVVVRDAVGRPPPGRATARGRHRTSPRVDVRGRPPDGRRRVRRVLRPARDGGERHHQDADVVGDVRAAPSPGPAPQALREDSSLIPGAVEEMLRFCNPVHYQRRTAVCDTVLGDTRITAGDKVAIYYTSANRDDDVFADAESFDVRRTPNAHLSFGIGAHFCLGAQLARLEARVFFEELLTRFATIELAGEPVKTRSNFINGYKRMPVRLAH